MLCFPPRRSRQNHDWQKGHQICCASGAAPLKRTPSAAAPQAPPAALGFRVEVQKWLVLVRLLLGEIPERTGEGGDGIWMIPV